MNAKAQSPLIRAIAVSIAASLAIGTLVLAFVWPTKTLEVKNVPVSVAGPAAVVEAFESALDENLPGKFVFVEATSRDNAVKQIENRTTYGAIILPAQGEMPEVLTAPAANAMVAQLLTGVAQQLRAQLVQKIAAMGLDTSSVNVAVTPIVSLAETDPTGAGMTSAAFPLMIGGIMGGAISSLLIAGRRNKLLFLILFPVVASTIIVAILQTWFGFLQQDFILNAAAVALSIAATASIIAGLSNVIGRAGLVLAAAFTFLIANPLSAAAMPWQFIAEPWGAFGQYLVPGASNWMLKSLSYFPATDLSQQWWTLTIWVVVGLALLAVPKLKK